MSDDQRFAKWQRWIERIRSDVKRVHRQLAIFERTVEIYVLKFEHADVDHSFFAWLGQVFETAALMHVRRQTKQHPDALSLAQLLEEMIETPAIISRWRHAKMFADTPLHDMADEIFDTLVAPERDYVDPETLERELRVLNERCVALETIVDQHLAHLDVSPKTIQVTYGELRKGIECINAFTIKYHKLLCGYAPDLSPVLNKRWEEVFHQTWLHESGESRN